MTPESADLLVRGTAQLAMAAYAAALGLRLAGGAGRAGRSALARVCYVPGCAIYWIHIACAFHFVHGWSHIAAYEHTARRTAETVGWSWGGGLYFNYLFTLLWTADALWMLAAPASYERRSRAYDLLVQGFLSFMAVNAVVVFGPPTTRTVGAAVCALLVYVWRRHSVKESV